MVKSQWIRTILPLPFPPLSLFGSRFISRAVNTESPLPSVFLCFETKRKRLLRRLVSPQPPRVFRISFYWTTFHHYLGAWNRLTPTQESRIFQSHLTFDVANEWLQRDVLLLWSTSNTTLSLEPLSLQNDHTNQGHPDKILRKILKLANHK